MAKYLLYGNATNNSAQSTTLKSSNSFSVENSKPWKYGQRKIMLTPIVESSNGRTVDRLAEDRNPAGSSVYMQYSHINGYLKRIHKTIGILDDGAQATFKKNIHMYNRFKLPTLNDAFQKGYAHVFFTRPDCNILTDQGKTLNSSFENNPEFSYAFRNTPDMVKQLSLNNGQSHDFMFSISNKAASFSLSDEFIDTDTYGKTYSGWKIAYGRNNVESKTAGDFSVTYRDDRTLHIYQLHKLWVDYISGAYQGRYAPKSQYIRDRILDYACACYYIITAEDGETIIFWSKYYGVFPSTIPSTQYAWAYGNLIQDPQIEIKYNYSFKEDFNPDALVEFNYNAGIGPGVTGYVPIYDPKLGHVGDTWVGTPFIELVTGSIGNDGIIPESPYTFKLRFRKN